MSDPGSAGYNITKDPALAKSRIFLGNLPVCTREELVSICQPYGKVLGSMVQKNYGFVQFETEELANKAAFALHKSTFKQNMLTVTVQGGLMMSAAAAAAGQPLINDCEIIVQNRENTKYAEYIEERLKNSGLRVDVLFPNEDVLLGKVLANISSRGCLYAVLVTPQHEEHNSITVNILYGVPAEHRNMPLEDAITLISTDFRLKKQRDAVVLPPASSIHKGQRRHPEEMQGLLERLADNHPLTASQYEVILKYLEGEREEQLKREVGEANALAKLKAPDPEIELQKKILSIMNKPAVTDITTELMYPTFEAVKEDRRLMELLADDRVLAALESVYNSDLRQIIAEHL
ncbi:GD14001 [Drosophila simulans]|uniref:GD14001 n=1 Tax=Drosophila simulans TaxID=7240 RepID=B4QKA9_DROSI|nr:GD14001 [Drosophila simulans]